MRLYLFSLLLTYLSFITCVDKSNFKTCEQSSFCKRNRNVRGQPCHWTLLPETLVQSHDKLGVEADLKNTENGVFLKLTLMAVQKDGSVLRMKITEPHSGRERFEARDAILENIEYSKVTIKSKDNDQVVVTFGDKTRGQKAVITVKPFRIDIYADDKLVISGNARGFMKYEHFRRKEEVIPPNDNPEDQSNKEDTEGVWEETFKTFTDSKPFGPMSVGMDFSFVGFEHVYGIPEHADSFALRDTKDNSDPYRLYNVDIFEYETESPMALYGAIPMMLAQSTERTVGLLWLNPSETWIDIESFSQGIVGLFSNLVTGETKPRLTHWFSETGVIDTWFMLGPKPSDVMQQNALITGATPLPPYYSIGYHQSRWNYFTQNELNTIDSSFDDADIPLDALWLDIEYTEDRSKKYFTWDQDAFPDQKGLISNLTRKGRRLITIVDPHLKKDTNYPVFNEGVDNNFFIKTSDGKDYEGWCWPGNSMWPDYLNPAVSEWWSNKFNPEFFPGFVGGIVDIWNDMNEPSVFNGPEVTAPKDLRHFNGVEHRDIHNMYGLLMTRATYLGLIHHRPNLRPFILTRSFFAGSQKYCAAWTGDNMSKWNHLQATIPMLLSLSITGMTFVGADVPGFFFDPDSTELVVRWYQAGAFQPFFRGHAHLHTRHREPYTYSDEIKNHIRNSIRLRYNYLPYIYTLFYENSLNGSPPMRPLWYNFPKDAKTFNIEKEFMLGDALLICPVQEEGVNSIEVYFPGEGESWLDLESKKIYKGDTTVTIPVDLSSLPRFQRSGTLIVKRSRPRRSAALTLNDPVTLEIFLDSEERFASGRMYIDDGLTFQYKSGAYIYSNITYNQKVITHDIIHGSFSSKSWVEKIIIYRISNVPRRIETTKGAVNLSFSYDTTNKILIIKKPELNLHDNWKIRLI